MPAATEAHGCTPVVVTATSLVLAFRKLLDGLALPELAPVNQHGTTSAWCRGIKVLQCHGILPRASTKLRCEVN
ncbi:hypothetical protein SACS_0029 [Parasaccharibacter apium]|uniref:Uncharacterized protein n=1 Tax=Parasaccharibacter apium TaxID=1510841 RepID=A0A7U7J078_9PROT|nr:hypothetical protein SACS_0029 [Parasaccharibacter apium]